MRTSMGWALALSATAAVSAGCNRHARKSTTQPPVAVATHTHTHAPQQAGTAQPAPVESPALAVEDLALARCEREQRCDRIGANDTNATFPTKEECVIAARADLADDITPAVCPNGAPVAEVEDCVEELRADDCDNPSDTIQRVVACRVAEICGSGSSS
jgi:hypothetical protein